jgi:hypothetical protein
MRGRYAEADRPSTGGSRANAADPGVEILASASALVAYASILHRRRRCESHATRRFADGTAIAEGGDMTTSRTAALILALLAAGAGRAVAQPAPDDEPQPRAALPAPPPPLQAVPDNTLQALRGRVLAVTQRSGAVLVGELVGFDAVSVTLALAPSRAIVTFSRADVAGLQLAEGPPPALAPAAPLALALTPPAPERKRYFGLQLGIAPGVMMDLQVGHFYAFANADLVLPTADTNLLGFAFGAGVTFPLGTRSHWNMDVFAHLNIAQLDSYEGNIVGGGLGMGFHYTAPNGFTVGFKFPIFGYSGLVKNNDTGSDNGSAQGVAYYYLSSVMSLPVVSIGYRF